MLQRKTLNSQSSSGQKSDFYVDSGESYMPSREIPGRFKGFPGKSRENLGSCSVVNRQLHMLNVTARPW